MTIDSLQATNAYTQIAQTTQNVLRADNGTAPSALSQQDIFADLVQDAVSQTRGNIQTAENASAAVVTGEANLVDVVTTISAAEISLEAAIAVRNRMIEAYQEIMRMPI